MKLWNNIDGAEAEAQLRGLNRRLADLDEAMRDSQRMLADNPDSFAAKLGLNSLSQLQQRLQSERVELVKHRVREKVDVALLGASFNDHTASLGRLGIFLWRLQGLYQSIGQAITTGPRLRGPISQEILRATDLRLAHVFPSSFGMELFVTSSFDEFGESTSVAALQTLFNLLTATKRENEIGRLSAELGQRSVNHLRKVLTELHRDSAGFSLSWTDSAGTKYAWDADNSDIPRLRESISRYQERSIGEHIYDGALIGASLLRNRFEFMDMDKAILEGKITRAVRPQLREYFGQWCRVTLEQVEVFETVSGETKVFYTLIGIAPRTRQ
ncbi:hypothetical protein [Methylobacterium sp. SI9]|uniref:hypothetical protein n=1 Tax=Methylobacterium guangdongense TaxID=3138811 RepID=UPI00313D43D8